MNVESRGRRLRIRRRVAGLASVALVAVIVAGCGRSVGQWTRSWPQLPSPGIAIVSLPPDTEPPATPTRRPTPPPTATASPTAQATSAPATRTPVRTPARTTPAPSGLVGLPTYADRVDGTTVTHYAITGSTESALISGMESNAQNSCGADALACFNYQFAWSYSTQTSGGVCTVTSVSITKTYRMVLPQWTSPIMVPARLATWWGQVHDHIFWHENQHRALADAFIPTLQAGIKAGPCDATASEANASTLLNQLAAQQKAFDTSDSGWTWPPY